MKTKSEKSLADEIAWGIFWGVVYLFGAYSLLEFIAFLIWEYFF